MLGNRSSPTLVPIRVSLGNLLLDPRNYRIAIDLPGGDVDESRYVVLQPAILKVLLEKHKVYELKASIMDHSWLPVDQIVVRRLRVADGADSLYVVVEGNRRVAALRDLLYDYTERGKQAPVDLVRASEALDVLLIDGGTREAQEDLANRIMGMRHVTGGVKAWGGAEAAMIIVDLVDRKHLSMADAAESLVGVSTIEARRRYRAYKAYKEAVHDGFGEARMFTLLGEAIRTKTLREWLAWSDSANRFENREALNLVYYLITKNAEGEEDEDAISNVQAMRNLRFVVDDAGALACLIRTRSLAAAQAVLRGRVSDQSASSTSLASLARAIAS